MSHIFVNNREIKGVCNVSNEVWFMIFKNLCFEVQVRRTCALFYLIHYELYGEFDPKERFDDKKLYQCLLYGNIPKYYHIYGDEYQLADISIVTKLIHDSDYKKMIDEIIITNIKDTSHPLLFADILSDERNGSYKVIASRCDEYVKNLTQYYIKLNTTILDKYGNPIILDITKISKTPYDLAGLNHIHVIYIITLWLMVYRNLIIADLGLYDHEILRDKYLNGKFTTKQIAYILRNR